MQALRTVAHAKAARVAQPSQRLISTTRRWLSNHERVRCYPVGASHKMSSSGFQVRHQSLTKRFNSSVSAPSSGRAKPIARQSPNKVNSSTVSIPIDGEPVQFSTILLRDACSCPSCVHETSNQRLFSVADIPDEIKARSVELDDSLNSVSIKWETDIPGYSVEHTTQLDMTTLKNISRSGYPSGMAVEPIQAQVLWSQDRLGLPDYEYDNYMNSDSTLYDLMCQLRTHGVAFVTNVPGLEESLAKIATRMGPLKDTFYGDTWDVRTVPEAINAAYTSGDLGFHTDLLYFYQPPHIQLLHCVQSASQGGASVFADAYKAAVDLFHTDIEAFDILATLPVNYHYNHPDSNVYKTTKPVIDLHHLQVGEKVYTHIQDYIEGLHLFHGNNPEFRWTDSMLAACMDKINWGPPFLAPFSLHEHSTQESLSSPPLTRLNEKVEKWHQAAKKFNNLLQRPEYLFERKMNPGDCVLFDNTRTLHSRRSFEMADIGKPRWLRGTYVDKDPFYSKLRVLRNKFGSRS